jgi:hypothetical protein
MIAGIAVRRPLPVAAGFCRIQESLSGPRRCASARRKAQFSKWLFPFFSKAVAGLAGRRRVFIMPRIWQSRGLGQQGG